MVHGRDEGTLSRVGSRLRFDNFAELERLASRRLPRILYEQLAKGTDRNVTLRANVEAFDEVFFRPRAAVDTPGRNLRTTVLGTEIAFPVMLAPVGSLNIISPAGAVGAAQAAGEAGTISVASMVAGHSPKEIRAASSGPLWQQIYMTMGRKRAEERIAEASACGYSALVATVDFAVMPPRQTIQMNARTALRFAPDVLSRPRWLANFLTRGPNMAAATTMSDQGLPPDAGPVVWKDLAWMREAWRGPLVVKGVLTADDARRALDCGASAVIVSNHGGFVVDGLPATLRSLEEVLEGVGGQIEVLLDGGVRQGTDVVKAVAMGARAVLIGRPYTFGLAVAGAAGVWRVLDLFRRQIDATLGNLGCPGIEALDQSYLMKARTWSDRLK